MLSFTASLRFSWNLCSTKRDGITSLKLMRLLIMKSDKAQRSQSNLEGCFCWPSVPTAGVPSFINGIQFSCSHLDDWAHIKTKHVAFNLEVDHSSSPHISPDHRYKSSCDNQTERTISRIRLRHFYPQKTQQKSSLTDEGNIIFFI